MVCSTDRDFSDGFPTGGALIMARQEVPLQEACSTMRYLNFISRMTDYFMSTWNGYIWCLFRGNILVYIKTALNSLSFCGFISLNAKYSDAHKEEPKMMQILLSSAAGHATKELWDVPGIELTKLFRNIELEQAESWDHIGQATLKQALLRKLTFLSHDEPVRSQRSQKMQKLDRRGGGKRR